MKRFAVAILLSLFVCGTASRAADFDFFRAISAVAKGAKAYTLTNDDIIEIVKEAVKEMDAQNKVAPASNAYAKRLTRLTSKMKSIGAIPLNFKVYITNDVNAFACADGSVRVFSGLMDIMNDNELIAILGHEMGHVGKNHTLKQFKRELYNSAIVDAAGAMSETIADLSDGIFGALGLSMMSLKYSRDQEREADDFSYDFLKKRGTNPYCLVTAFENLQKMAESGKNSKVLEYFNRMFSSHPQTKERISHIKDRCQKDGFKK